MNLTTERLNLRPLQRTDLDNIHALHSTPAVDKYNTMGIPQSVRETEQIMLGWMMGEQADPIQRYTFVIENKAGDFIGLAGIIMGKPNYRSAEIWYKLNLNQWSKGYATEAVKGMLQFCFATLQLHRVEAGCAAANVASARVLEKAGMTLEGVKRKVLPIRGEWLDGNNYGVLDEDYLNTGMSKT